MNNSSKIAALCLSIGMTFAAAQTVMSQTAAGVEAKRQAVIACWDETGVGGELAMDVKVMKRVGSARTSSVKALPSSSVTPALADQINACASRQLGLSAPVQASARPITNQSYGGKIGQHSSSQDTHRWQVPGCPPGFNGMFRGTLYCVNGRPFD